MLGTTQLATGTELGTGDGEPAALPGQVSPTAKSGRVSPASKGGTS